MSGRPPRFENKVPMKKPPKRYYSLFDVAHERILPMLSRRARARRQSESVRLRLTANLPSVHDVAGHL